MASFTDSVPQFNPYVSQLPVEAMVKVGTYKQEKYEEGVTKIQSQIDQVAGLDLARGVDKDYLQAKLDELGNNLKYVAAGDFSNFQLVNSVGGMAKQIGRDATVRNAVASTAWYRSQQKAIEEAKKQGKSNVANEDLFSSQVNKWYTDPTVGASFSDEYVPYTDVFKKLQDIAKSVGEDSTIVQQLFQTDANGNPVLVNGKLQYNDVMAETLLKGKDKEKILSAFQNGLDSNDYRQLSITGRYELKGKSTADVSKMLGDGFIEYQKNMLTRKDLIQDKILELKTKGGSQKEIDALQEAAANIDVSINKRKNSIDQSLSSGDMDAIKGSIYTNNYLDSMAGAFSTKETYTKYMKNPAVEMMLERDRLKLDQNKFKFDQDKFAYQQLRDIEEDKLTKWKALFEKGLVDENGKPTGAGLYSSAYRNRALTDIDDDLFFTNNYIKGVEDDANAQFGLYEKVAVADWMAKNSGKINPDTGKPYSGDEMKKQIANQAKKVGVSYNDYIVLQGQKATDKWNQSKGKSLGSEYADDFSAINELGVRIGIAKKTIDKEQGYINANSAGFTPVDVNKLNINPVTITAVIGGEAEGRGKMRRENVTLSKQDVLDFAKFIYHDYEGTLPGVLDSDAIKTDAKNAKERLIKKYGTAGFESMQTQLRGSEKWNPADLNPLNVVFNPTVTNIKQNPEIAKAVNILKSDNFKKTMQLREKYYKEMSGVAVPGAIVLYKDKAEQKEHLQSAISSVASDYAGIDAGYEDLVSAVNQEGSHFQINIDPAASRYGNNSYSLQVTKKDGSIVTKPITESHFQDITRMNAPSMFIDDLTATINASDYGSTNLAHAYTDDDAYTTAFVKDSQTRTKNYNVAMDFVRGSRGMLFPKLYIQTGDNDWKLVPFNKGLTPQEAKNFPISVDDVFVKSLLQSK